MNDKSINGIRAYIVDLGKRVAGGDNTEYALAEQYTMDDSLTVELAGRMGVSRFRGVRLIYVIDKGEPQLVDYSVQGWAER